MDDYDDGVSNSWQMKLFPVFIGSLIMVYGVWCLYRGQAYIIGMSSGLSTFHGLAADFVAWSDICFAAMMFVSLIPFTTKKPPIIIVSVLFLLFFVLSGIGIFI